MKPGIKRLIIEVTEIEHKQIKQYAIEKNITLRKLIMRAIIKYINEEKQYE